ncbi:DsbA family protein [Actinacidiphila sp. ITFR-21]|uniref:DsbA family protein n=1 Tax=Actinacidiphila sp. ITFR-21 TaxID=3075199 RepID=UPI00288A0EA1|nr:thioredoxin domain-containing protein [Streptomyces sp. ITFR-21]WNI15082.1 thioredoxin domain-containing protein [Streptomyces sp. ITFR-21]
MSQRNREEKRSAREALQEQRAKDKHRAKRKRTLVVAGAVVAVLAVGAVIGVVVAGSDSGGGTDSAGSVSTPRGTVGKDGLVVPVGAADAPSTLTIYEDFRCPACDSFEKSFTPTVHDLEGGGQLRTEYHLVTLIDGNLGGSGSLTAANAAACAQDAGRFRAFHDVLYADQPDEQDDAFADKDTLLRLAGKVPGLRTPSFTACVNNGTHDKWVKKSNDAFNSSGFNSTPTVLLNGKNVYGSQSPALTPDSLRQLVRTANKGKQPGKVTATPS